MELPPRAPSPGACGPKSLAQREVERHRLERPCPKRAPKLTAFLLADVIGDYLAEAATYKRSYRDDVRYGRMWTERFEARLLEELTPAELERVKTERVQLVEPATVNRELAFLKHVYNVAIRDSKTERNPVSKIKLLREPSGRVRYLTDDEEARLMAALPTDAERQRATVLLQTGLRKSEFLGLRWKDADLRAGVLTIPRSKNGETRHVPMTSDVRNIFSRLPRPLDGSTLVFPNTVGMRDSRWANHLGGLVQLVTIRTVGNAPWTIVGHRFRWFRSGARNHRNRLASPLRRLLSDSLAFISSGPW
jgi:integrase